MMHRPPRPPPPPRPLPVMAAMTFALSGSGCLVDVFQLPTGAQGIAQTMQQWFAGGIYPPQQVR